MKKKIAIECCCAGKPIGSCPCQTGTLTGAHDLTFSGITNLTLNGPLGPFTLQSNRTYSAINFVVDQTGCRLTQTVEVFSEEYAVQLLFTRAALYFIGIGVNQTQYTLPAGVKAIARMTAGIEIRPLGSYSTEAITTCFFYKVVNSDPVASIDCSNTLSTFTFGGQYTPPADGYYTGEPTFDATLGSVSYA